MITLSENEMKNIHGGWGLSIIPTYILVSKLIKIIVARFR